MMVGLVSNDRPGPVDLLKEHHARHLVIEDARGKADGLVSAGAHFIGVAKRATNAEYNARGVAISCTAASDSLAARWNGRWML